VSLDPGLSAKGSHPNKQHSYRLPFLQFQPVSLRFLLFGSQAAQGRQSVTCKHSRYISLCVLNISTRPIRDGPRLSSLLAEEEFLQKPSTEKRPENMFENSDCVKCVDCVSYVSIVCLIDHIYPFALSCRSHAIGSIFHSYH
jgi:hypothetical protein